MKLRASGAVLWAPAWSGSQAESLTRVLKHELSSFHPTFDFVTGSVSLAGSTLDLAELAALLDPETPLSWQDRIHDWVDAHTRRLSEDELSSYDRMKPFLRATLAPLANTAGLAAVPSLLPDVAAVITRVDGGIESPVTAEVAYTWGRPPLDVLADCFANLAYERPCRRELYSGFPTFCGSVHAGAVLFEPELGSLVSVDPPEGYGNLPSIPDTTHTKRSGRASPHGVLVAVPSPDLVLCYPLAPVVLPGFAGSPEKCFGDARLLEAFRSLVLDAAAKSRRIVSTEVVYVDPSSRRSALVPWDVAGNDLVLDLDSFLGSVTGLALGGF